MITKNNQIDDLLMKNIQIIALSGLLKEDIFTGIEMFIFDKDGVKNILNFICEITFDRCIKRKQHCQVY